MTIKLNVNDIVQNLRTQGVIDSRSEVKNQMDGTTDGLVFTVQVNEAPKYVLKLDHPQHISLVTQFKQTYRDSPLLPKLIYIAPDNAFFVYSYLTGTTDYKRGSKAQWLTILASGLINHYKRFSDSDKWGYWLEEPCDTWRDFLALAVEYARNQVGSYLSLEDYSVVKSFVENTALGEEQDRFLLHGDCGVHNFVFEQDALTGVIDPSPIIGPPLYDFLYAFCSSPDDLNLETLMPAFSLLHHTGISQSKLVEEVIIQLYYRIAICLKHHPQDLSDYLKAWSYWKTLISH
ncbi:phosphotransferase [Paenibacillus sp. FJAT-27812]|uniref:phosphotransferase n=1 Tax=Paenibacillus sp. FJAT-27812 TaxID=1684143 RepID=UPI0006A77514|nr:phosphotransferase [Paenibacillus sp. FJAT-27812]